MGAGADDLAADVLLSSTDGHLALSSDGRVRWADPSFCRMVAVPEDEVVGADVGVLLGSAARRRWTESVARSAVGRSSGDNRELLLLGRDGRRVWALASWGPMPPRDGEVLTWVRVTEYGERRRLLATLADREDHLGTTHELARLGTVTWRVGTDEVTWSTALAALLGEGEDEVPATLARSLDRVLPEGRALIERDLTGPLVRGQRFTWQVQATRADGSVATLRVIAEVVPAADGSACHEVRGTVQDVTAVVESAAQAVDARSQLLLLLGVAEAANEATGLTDALDSVWTVLRRHDTWRPIAIFVPLGGEAVDGDHPPGPAVLPRLTRHLARADQPGVVESASPPDPVLARVAWRSGEVRAAPVPALDSTHTSLAVPVLRDGTTCAVVQIDLPESPVDPATVRLVTRMADLLGAVAQREHDAQRLAEARDEAERASRLKSDFLATMSHEIRTPMNGVIGLTELLLRTPLDDQQQNLTEALRGTGRTLLALINDILDLSRIESGRLELDRTEIDVRAVVEQAVGVVAGQARSKGLELAVTCEPEVPEVAYGDAVRLGQVVTNLCSNAVKFTDAGAVEVRVSLTGQGGPPAEPQDGAARTLLRVEVRDTGIGVEVGDDPDQLFEAFTQADPSTTRRHGGSGLGLAISRRLVDAMGGHIGLTSAPGLGSTFFFTAALDAAPDPRAGAARPHERGTEQLQGRRVLVVDDHAASRRSFLAHLRAWGAEPRSCTRIDKARDEVHRATAAGAAYDVVVLDRSLPGDDTTSVLGLAHELAATPGGPGLVLLDGTAPEHGGRKGDLSACFHATATKPAVRDDLWHALTVALDRGGRVGPRRTTGTLPSGVRVLVAEDNTVNQMVAVGLLESLGCTVDVAVDGEQALARLTPGHGYHVVLMDCRMPHVDGLEAARRLRAAEAATKAPRVPVLAMTASVLNGERERCLEAGMDDFLTKPVSRAHLARALARWASLHRLDLPDQDDQDAPAPAGSGEQVVTTEPDLLYPDEDERPVLDFERVEMLRELVKDGLSFFDRTRESYLARVGSLLDQVAAAAGRGDLEALLGLVHQLKGSSANLGLVRVADRAREVEDAARAQDLPGVQGLLDDLAADLVQARRALNSVGRTAESRPPPMTTRRPVHPEDPAHDLSG